MKEFYGSWTDGYQRSNSTLNRRKKYFSQKKKKNTFYSSNEGDLFKSKSRSLDVITEELYLFGIQESIEVRKLEASKRTTRPFIPRVKLTRSAKNLGTENFFFQMSAKENFQNSSQQSVDDVSENVKVEEQDGLRIEKCNIFDESLKKPEQNYFTKNVDEQVQCTIVDDHKDSDNSIPHKKNFEENPVNGNTAYEAKKIILPENSQICELQLEHAVIQLENDNNKTNKFLGIKLECEGKFSGNPTANIAVDGEKLNSEQPDEETAVILERQRAENGVNNQPISEWYNGLKQHFEKTETSESHKSKEMTCRITGATLKKSNGTLGEKDNDTKHYFSRLVKTNRTLIDEELPDPDKVKNIRAMFQENSNSSLKRNLYQALGGSLQNISTKAAYEHFARPLSAQCNREDIMCELLDNDAASKKMETRFSNTSVSENPKDLMNDFMNKNTKKKILAKYEKDLRMTREFRNKKLLSSKWTDTGSISSGVSSDLSSYDTDVENFSKEETEVEPEDITISDDDYLDEDKDKHFVENEFLEKIRSFGTTVTYYGGEMINCSVGPILSPTAIAIMNEINEKYGHKGSITKSFAEFYRKYVEINEPYTMKKLGKSRSFGQSDVFQKPNVMNNNEIELYKNDLETEIGIRKPLGISSNTLKRNLNKSKNEGCHKDKNLCDKTSDLEKPSRSVTDSFKQVEETPTKVGVIRDIDNFIEPKEISVETAKSKPEEQDGYVQQSDFIQSNSRSENEVGTFTETQIKIPHSQVEIEDNYITQERHITKEPDKEIKSEYFETTPKEILFGYEKNLFNSKRHSDMEFEEFEVCKSIDEKTEKSDATNVENTEDSKASLQEETRTNPNIEIIITEEPSQLQEPENDEENITVVEVQSTNKEVKAEPVPPRKWNINLNEVEGTTFPNEKAVELNNEIRDNLETKEEQNIQENGFDCDTEKNKIIAVDYDYGKSHKKNYKNKHSRWPIKTTVVVDIQKEVENTPKIITNGKISSKPKKRLF